MRAISVQDGPRAFLHTHHVCGHIVPSSVLRKAFMPYFAMGHVGLHLLWKLHIFG